MADRNSYVKLCRSIIDSEEFQDPMDLKVFIWCMVRAGYTKHRWKGETLKAGQFITSMRNASVELSMSVNTVRRHLDTLADMGAIKAEPDSRWTKITVINYCKYQGKSESVSTDDTPSDTRGDTHGDTRGDNKQEYIRNTDKSVLKENKKEAQPQISDSDEQISWDDLKGEDFDD